MLRDSLLINSENILALLREEFMIAFPSSAEVFGWLTFKPSSGPDDLADSEMMPGYDSYPFNQSDIRRRLVFYDPAALIQLFLQDLKLLKEAYLSCFLHLYDLMEADEKSVSLPLFQSLLSGRGEERGLGYGSRSEHMILKKNDEIDYRTYLRRFMTAGEAARLDPDSFDYIPYYYGLAHYQDMPFIEPLEYQEVYRLDELAIAIDSSGSCSGEIVRRFFSETWSILRNQENFFEHMRVHFFQCDSFLQDYRVFESLAQWEEYARDLEIEGFGNTDFCPVFDKIEELKRKGEIRHLGALLYFSDGDGLYPAEKPDYETAFIFLNENLMKGHIPSWVTRINLGIENISR